MKFSNVLDNIQGSFKQVNSNVMVQGDPLLLLTKNQSKLNDNKTNYEVEELLSQLVHQAQQSNNQKELSQERLYARFINIFLEDSKEVPLDAKQFYMLIDKVVKQI